MGRNELQQDRKGMVGGRDRDRGREEVSVRSG